MHVINHLVIPEKEHMFDLYKDRHNKFRGEGSFSVPSKVTLCGTYITENPPYYYEYICSVEYFVFLMTEGQSRVERMEKICSLCQKHPDYNEIIGMALLKYV